MTTTNNHSINFFNGPISPAAFDPTQLLGNRATQGPNRTPIGYLCIPLSDSQHEDLQIMQKHRRQKAAMQSKFEKTLKL